MSWEALWTEGFEDGVGDWTVTEETFEQSDARAHTDTYSAYLANTAGSDALRGIAYRGFTRQTNKLRLDLYVWLDNGEPFYIQLSDTVEDVKVVTLRFYDGAVEYYDGASYQASGKTYSYDTWVHIEIECDMEADTITLEVDGEVGAMGYRVADPEAVDRLTLSVYSAISNQYAHWDDIIVSRWLVVSRRSFGVIMG